CMLASRQGSVRFGSDLAVGLGFALLLHGVLQLELPLTGIFFTLAKTFAGFSYSLYVLHFPILLLIRARVIRSRWQPDMMHLFCGLCICGIVLLYAFVIARLTEGNTSAFRAWIRSFTIDRAGARRVLIHNRASAD